MDVFFSGGTRGPRFAGCSRTPRPTGRIGKNPVLKDHNPVNEIQTTVLYNLPMTSSNSLKFSNLLNVSDLLKFLKFSHHREFEIQDFKQKTHQSKVILTVQVVRNKRYLISLSLSDSNIIKFFLSFTDYNCWWESRQCSTSAGNETFERLYDIRLKDFISFVYDYFEWCCFYLLGTSRAGGSPGDSRQRRVTCKWIH